MTGVSFHSQDSNEDSRRVRAALTVRVRAEATRLGFDAVGIARADVALEADHERYRAFLDAKMHGEMAYLAENVEVRRRLDGDGILAGAKSVVCVARRYQRTSDHEARDGETAQLIARYARGRDYHNFLKRKLRKLATFLRRLGTEDAPVQARPMTDDAPLLERAWAARAGLGFIGKNGLLIIPGLGSMVLLGEVVTTLALEVHARDEHEGAWAERCGSCTRCLDVCPTRAFAQPFVLDARKCISYLTIEQRGAVPNELREGVGTHLFGCDDCQTACPFNKGHARAALDAMTRDQFEPLERWATTHLEALLDLDEGAWRALSEGSPLRRATREGLARNAAIVLGNRGDARAVTSLRAAASAHPDEVVREAAQWAVTRLTT